MARTASDDIRDLFGLTHHQPSGFLPSVAALDAAEDSLPQAHAVRRAWQELALTSVLYVGRHPTAYIKTVSSLSEDDLRVLHRRFWSHGTAPLLVVVGEKDVRVYSAYALPATSDEGPDDAGRLVRVLERTSEALEIHSLLSTIETGRIYEDHRKSFKRDHAVDHYLLRNLRAFRRALQTGRDALAPAIAQAFLTRIIFVSYLIERRIVQLHGDSPDVRPAGWREYLFRDGGEVSKRTLYDLFRRLKRDFNGTLFDADLDTEASLVTQEHMDTLRRFLKGDKLDDPQLTLGFWAYDFSLIPIETISAIYEDFVRTDDGATTRGSGTYYTPPHLAELTIDTAIERWQSCLNKRVLDPACGSGIFLVSMFNRMAEEWRKHNPNVGNSERATALRRILEENLVGVDISKPACRVTCFSLYLALLDQLEPRDIHVLQKTSRPFLPSLLRVDRLGSQSATKQTIICANFFDAHLDLQSSGFDLVVGNPPWVSRGHAKDATFDAWVQGHPQCPVPQRQIAHGFMWKAPECLAPDGTACLLLPSKAILNISSEQFQRQWLRRVAVEKVVLLADMSFFLFPSAAAPAAIVRFRRDGTSEDYIDYYVPKTEHMAHRVGPISIAAEDRKVIRRSVLRRWSERREAGMLWKTHFWGTPRDIKFIERLLDMPRLSDLVGEPGAGKPWVKGQGFKPEHALEGAKSAHEPFWSQDDLFLDAKRWFGLCLRSEDCERVGARFGLLHRLPDHAVFRAPAVILNQGFTHIALSRFPVLFRHALQAISGPTADMDLLGLLAGVLSSPIARYFLFHTAANWGTERDKVLLDEVTRLPFPLPEETGDPKEARRLMKAVNREICKLEISNGIPEAPWRREVEAANERIKPLVYAYYQVDPWEAVLIEDTDEVYEPSSTPPPRAGRNKLPTLRDTTESQRRVYVNMLCDVLNAWASPSIRVGGYVTVSQSSGLAVMTLQKRISPPKYSEIEGETPLDEILTHIAGLLPQKRAGFEELRNLKIFDGDALHIFKPLALRHWTRTQALNDADDIAGAILGQSGGGTR